MDDMTLLYMEGSGQILAAIAPTSGFADEPTAEELAGPDLVVRGEFGTPDALVPVDQLSVATVASDEGVVADPTAYRQSDGKPTAVLGTILGFQENDEDDLVVAVDPEPEALPGVEITTPLTVTVIGRAGINGSSHVSMAALAIDSTVSTALVPPLPAGIGAALIVIEWYRSTVADQTEPVEPENGNQEIS